MRILPANSEGFWIPIFVSWFCHFLGFLFCCAFVLPFCYHCVCVILLSLLCVILLSSFLLLSGTFVLFCCMCVFLLCVILLCIFVVFLRSFLVVFSFGAGGCIWSRPGKSKKRHYFDGTRIIFSAILFVICVSCFCIVMSFWCLFCICQIGSNFKIYFFHFPNQNDNNMTKNDSKILTQIPNDKPER